MRKRLGAALSLVMAVAFVAVGCGEREGEALKGETVQGEFFSVTMPGTPETHTEIMEVPIKMNFDDIEMKMYEYADDSTNEAFFVMEFDWSELVNMVREQDTNEAMATGLTRGAMSSFGEMEIVEYGNTKAAKIKNLKEVGIPGVENIKDDSKVELYIILTDQAVVMTMYLVEDKADFNKRHLEGFMSSFQLKNTTNDYIKLDLLEK